MLQDATPLTPVGPRVFPPYPGFAYLEGHAGRVMVEITVGASGAVWDATVEQSSGYRELDTAALRAVRHWQFNKLDRSMPAYIRHARAPINFSFPPMAGEVAMLPRGPNSDVKQSKPKLEWPRAYAHPRYVESTRSVPYQDPASALASLSKAAEPVFRLNGILIEYVDADANGRVTDIWFVLNPGTPDSMAVRYAFAGASTDPVVAVSAVCAPHDSVCAGRMPQLLQGPFFARASGSPTAP